MDSESEMAQVMVAYADRYVIHIYIHYIYLSYIMYIIYTNPKYTIYPITLKPYNPILKRVLTPLVWCVFYIIRTLRSQYDRVLDALDIKHGPSHMEVGACIYMYVYV
jgi:hypothetical protein